MLVVTTSSLSCVDSKGVVTSSGDGERVCVLESDVAVGGVLPPLVEIVDGRAKVHFPL